MEKAIQNTVKAPLYCNSIVYFLIVAFVVTVDFLTYKEIMDANFQNIGQSMNNIITAGLVVIVDSLPMVLASLLKIKEKTVKVVMISSLAVVGILLLTSIGQRLCSSDLMFNDAADVISSTESAHEMSMVMLSILPIATSFFTFALSVDKAIWDSRVKLARVKSEIAFEEAKLLELQNTLAFDQLSFENHRYSEAIASLEKLGVSMEIVARQILAEHLGDNKSVTQLTTQTTSAVAPTAAAPAASATAAAPVAIPLTQQTY